MSIKTSNWALKEQFSYSPKGNRQDSKTLAAGSFVKPIEWRYLPKHITEDSNNSNHDANEEVFCYTKHGIIAIPRRILEEK